FERRCMRWHEANFSAFAVNAQMKHSAAELEVFHFQFAKLLATESVKKKSGKDGTVTFAFERVKRRRVQERTGLAVTQRGRLAFVRISKRTFDPFDWIVRHRVLLAQIIEER